MQESNQFSQSNPPRTIEPVNNNAVGAHNELFPNNEYKPELPKIIKSVRKSIIHQRKTNPITSDL